MAPVRSTPGTQVLSQGQVNPSQVHLSQLPPQPRSTPVIQAQVNSAPVTQVRPGQESTPVTQAQSLKSAPIRSTPVTPQVRPGQINYSSHSSPPPVGSTPVTQVRPQSGQPLSPTSAPVGSTPVTQVRPSRVNPCHSCPPQSGQPLSLMSAPVGSTPVTHVRPSRVNPCHPSPPHSGRTGPGQVHSTSHVKSRPQQCKPGLPLPGRAPPMACRQQQCNPPQMARAGVQLAA
jgi:hypothetical protein